MTVFTREDDARLENLKKDQAALMDRINNRRKARGQTPLAELRNKRDKAERTRNSARELHDRGEREERRFGSRDVLTREADDRATRVVASLTREIRNSKKANETSVATGELVELLGRRDGFKAMEEKTYARQFVARIQTREYASYDKNWKAYMIGGLAHAMGIAQEQQRYMAMAVKNGRFRGALHTEANQSGGFMVPEEIEYTIDRLLATTSIMRQLATTRQATMATLKKFFNMTGTTTGWVGEREARPETTTPLIKELEYPIQELYANPRMTQTMLDDAGFSVEAWLTEELQIAFEEAEGEAFINGDGNKKPWGLIGGYTTVANATWAADPAANFGTFGHVATGAASSFPTANPADILIDLHHSVRPAHRGNAKYTMNDLTAATISKFKDGEGQYLWKDKLADDHDGQLNGKPVMIDERFPDIGTNTYPIVFGDFAKGYLILDRFGIRTLRDELTAKPWVQFYTTKRLMGGAYNFEALKFLKCAVS